jgi:hypothetical protein
MVGQSNDSLFDEIEAGIRNQGELSPSAGSREDAELTDLDGVGPTTAKKLRRAEITSPTELQGVSTEAIAAIDGIGRKKAEQIKTQVEYGRPDTTPKPLIIPGEDENELRGQVYKQSRKVGIGLTGETDVEPEEREREVKTYSAGGDVPVQPGSVGVEGDDKQEALEHMADRSPEERQTDRLYNAPVTLDVDYWKEHSNEVDYPGVDTVPRGRKRKRALDRVDKAVDEGAIREFNTVSSGTSSFTGGLKKLSLGSDDDPEGTFAHELGHAVDSAVSDPLADEKTSHRLFQSEEAKEQAETLLQRRRNEAPEDTRNLYESDPFEDVDEEDGILGNLSGAKDYPFEEELFADVFASMAVEPRAAKREAPAAVREVEEELRGTGFLPGSPL